MVRVSDRVRLRLRIRIRDVVDVVDVVDEDPATSAVMTYEMYTVP